MTVCRRFDCRNEFEPRIQGGSPKQFCSGYCRLRWHRIRNEAKRWVWATLECPVCGVGFSTRNAPRSIAPSPAGSGSTRPALSTRSAAIVRATPTIAATARPSTPGSGVNAPDATAASAAS